MHEGFTHAGLHALGFGQEGSCMRVRPWFSAQRCNHDVKYIPLSLFEFCFAVCGTDRFRHGQPDGGSQLELPRVAAEALSGLSDGELPNSSTHKKQWNVLVRVATGPRSTQFPEIAQVFTTGSRIQQRECLQRYLQQGENLEQCEATFTAEKESSQEIRAGREQLTIKQMRDRGYSESGPHILAPSSI